MSFASTSGECSGGYGGAAAPVRRRDFLQGLAAALLLSACTSAKPVRIGYLGGLSGRIADLGEAGRNGTLLAVEAANAAGGIAGRSVELLVYDDEQNATVATRAAEELVAAGVAAVIGPMTSAMGEVVLPVAVRTNLVFVSPTITGTAFAGPNAAILRVAPSLDEITRRSAKYGYAHGVRSVAIAYDLANRSYSRDWVEHFRSHFTALGGRVVAEQPFTSGDEQSYFAAVRGLVDANPDEFHLVASAVDTVRLIQLLRNEGARQPVAASTWAATEYLLQLGGRAVEGVVLTQFFNREDSSPRYRAFVEAFGKRFRQDPGFASVAAYDATNAVFAALGQRLPGGIREALLSSGPYQGLQQSWSFDRDGSAQRAVHIAVVRNGQFQVVD